MSKEGIRKKRIKALLSDLTVKIPFSELDTYIRINDYIRAHMSDDIAVNHLTAFIRKRLKVQLATLPKDKGTEFVAIIRIRKGVSHE